MNDLDLKANWNQLKGSLKQRYGILTDDDLTFSEGKGEELLGRLQSKLALGKDELDRVLADLSAGGEDAGEKANRAQSTAGKVYADVKEQVGRAADDAKASLSETAESLKSKSQDAYQDARQGIEAGHGKAKEYVRANPTQAILTALGVGFIAGMLFRK